MKLWNAELLLGTNLGNRKENLIIAKNYISKEVGEIIQQSKIIETKPIGFTAEKLFLNQCICIKTNFSPITLLNSLKTIEKKMGRTQNRPKAGEKYSSRIIDLDILNYENIIFSCDKLSLPHHQIASRPFVKDLYLNCNS